MRDKIYLKITCNLLDLFLGKERWPTHIDFSQGCVKSLVTGCHPVYKQWPAINVPSLYTVEFDSPQRKQLMLCISHYCMIITLLIAKVTLDVQSLPISNCLGLSGCLFA